MTIIAKPRKRLLFHTHNDFTRGSFSPTASLASRLFPPFSPRALASPGSISYVAEDRCRSRLSLSHKAFESLPPGAIPAATSPHRKGGCGVPGGCFLAWLCLHGLQGRTRHGKPCASSPSCLLLTRRLLAHTPHSAGRPPLRGTAAVPT